MVFACDVGGASAIGKEDIIQIHGLTNHETRCGKGGALLQFGVPRFLYNKLIITHITESTMAIWLPCYRYQVAHLQVGGLYAHAREHGTLNAPSLLQGNKVGLPVGIVEKLRQSVERGKARRTVALDISPEAFNG